MGKRSRRAGQLTAIVLSTAMSGASHAQDTSLSDLKSTDAFGAYISSECRSDLLYLTGEWGWTRLKVEVADTAEKRRVGLMNRSEMSATSGMIFIYDTPGPRGFWMKNTLIPLDMLFIGPDGVVSHIHHNAIPHDETPIFGGPQIQYVLEVNGGMAKRLGITVGTQVLHPSVKIPHLDAAC